MKTIYRIEARNGHGVCHSHGLCDKYHAVAGGKCPANSFGTHSFDAWLAAEGVNGMHYAFPSIEALHAWFPNDAGRQAMARNGGHVVAYEVPDYIPDTVGAQCIFDPDKANVVATMAL